MIIYFNMKRRGSQRGKYSSSSRTDYRRLRTLDEANCRIVKSLNASLQNIDRAVTRSQDAGDKSTQVPGNSGEAHNASTDNEHSDHPIDSDDESSTLHDDNEDDVHGPSDNTLDADDQSPSHSDSDKEIEDGFSDHSIEDGEQFLGDQNTSSASSSISDDEFYTDTSEFEDDDMRENNHYEHDFPLFLPQNVLFGGLWFGESKPNFNTFLRPLMAVFERFKNGITVACEQSLIKVKGMLLSGIGDMPARSLMYNMINFNGAYGCMKCLTKEFKNFFFYYSVPLFMGILPDNYLKHFITLVEAAYLLHSDSVSDDDIDEARRLLKVFVKDFEILYGARFMSANLHSLLHLPDAVKKSGPLWVNSCFPLEDLNGKIARLVHATKSPEHQICDS
ncbi:UNVERIFIED_CONTAM: hypothetical protein B566_EDAN017696 [Ephemera danica]|nr:hypothetical protein B566_EDAN017696 [Ephemera danica]